MKNMVFVMILALSVVLAGFGCSSEDPPMVTEEIISTSPDTPEEVSALPVAPVPEVKKIKGLLGSGEFTHKQIAGMFNVGRSTVTDIRKGRTWSWL